MDCDTGSMGGRRKDIPKHWYRDNSLSKGGELKNQNIVLKARPEEKEMNMNCKIEFFGQLLDSFDAKKRCWVAEMGFEGLYGLVGKRLPRKLCYWLATRVDVPNKSFIASNGIEFPLSNVQVNWVFGLPIVGKKVPLKPTEDSMKWEIERIWETYSSTSPKGTKGICREKVRFNLRRDDISEDEFKECFLIVVLMDVICPTTCPRLSVKLLAAATLSKLSKEYDWCTFLLDHLLDCIRRFANRFYFDGYSLGCGGCIFFLAVLYLDKLNRSPVCWGIWPRIKAWSNKELTVAKDADMLDTGDYGKIGILDVAYGERHPKGPRDVLHPQANRHPDQFVYQNEDDAAQMPVGGYKRKTNVPNPWELRKSRDVEIERMVEDHLSGMVFTPSPSHGFRAEVRGNDGLDILVNHRNEGEVFIIRSVGSNQDGSGQNFESSPSSVCDGNVTGSRVALEGSRPRRRVVSRMTDEPFKHRFLKSLSILIQNPFGFPTSDVLCSDPVMLQCGGRAATFSVISKVFQSCGTLDVCYVGVAAVLYGKMWSQRHVGRSRRIMLDPEFAICALGSQSPTLPPDILRRSAVRLCGEEFSSLFSSINVVFVPVFNHGRWWCVMFSFNRREILVVDPCEPNNAVDLHHLSLMALIHAFEELLLLVDPSWEVGLVGSWNKISMLVEGGNDWVSGVLVIKAIKACADRLCYQYRVPRYNYGLSVHLCQDLFSDFNEVKDRVADMISSWRTSMKAIC